jgi:hypothetical protein
LPPLCIVSSISSPASSFSFDPLVSSESFRATKASLDSLSHSQVGGARLNLTNASIPYAELSLHRNALRLRCLGFEYVFPKDCIIALARYRGVISVGLHICHAVPTYPEFVVFWADAFWRGRRFAMLKERLEAFGYEMKD